jgi:hypothetical protein
MGTDRVLVAVDHEHGTVDAGAGVPEALEAAEVERLERLGQSLGRGLLPPGDAVLDLLRRVRLGEAPPEKELQEAGVVTEPVVPVVLRPPLVALELLVERIDRSLRMGWRKLDGRADEGGAVDPGAVVGSDEDAPESAAGKPHQRSSVSLRRVHHGERVEGELALHVGQDAVGPIRAPVPAPVEREHAEMARQVRDLRLPVPRVDDRPRRKKQHGLLSLAVELPEEPHAVALDIALLVGVPGTRLLARGQLDSHSSIQSRSSR